MTLRTLYSAPVDNKHIFYYLLLETVIYISATLYFSEMEGGYINGSSLEKLCGPFTSACVTPSLSPYEWFLSNAAWGLFERQVRQKAERTFFFLLSFFFNKARQLSSSTAHISKSVVYRGSSSVDTLYRIFIAAQTNHYSTHSLLLWFSSHQQWVVDCMENTRTIMSSVLVAGQR